MAAYPGNTTPQNADDQQLTLKKILLALIGGGPSGPIPVAPSSGSTVTRHSAMADSGGTAAVAIPAGAKGYSFNVLSGTAGDGTISGLPVGFFQGDSNTLVTGFTVTATGGQTAVFWNT